MKKINYAFGTALALILFQTANAEPVSFTDVTPEYKYFVQIDYLKQQNLIEGYADGTFKPAQDINRAEALKILQKAIKSKEKQINNEPLSFEDIKGNDWFYSYVLEGWKNNIVKGYPDQLFHPEKTINLAEALKMVLIQENSPIPTAVAAAPYPDVQIDDWYAPYAQVAKERTLVLVSRPEGYLNADTTLSRGAFTSLIYKILKTGQGSIFVRATWYGNEFANWGTASGVPFDPQKLTAAHKTLPFGTRLLVTNLANGKTVEVTVNDRGPYATGIDLDLSRAAFENIASLGAGIINIEYQEISKEETPKVENYGF
jgi:rare lipoprotein A